MNRYLPYALTMVAISLSLGAAHRTENFVVSAPTKELAREISTAAEQYRQQLTIEWLGSELPAWEDPCPIHARVNEELAASGSTRFRFCGGRPVDWNMSVQGSREQILDTVLPHEIAHTILATHFGRPIPRWIDEGISTLVEHLDEQVKQEERLVRYLVSGRGIAFRKMFRMQEYPRDMLPLYVQGHSLARYLIRKGGKQKFLKYVSDGVRSDDWTYMTQRHYGYQSLCELQDNWLDWVLPGI